MSRPRPLRVEPLENRLLLSAGLIGDDELAPMPDSLRVLSSGGGSLLGGAVPLTAEAYSTLANGMPILHSRAGAPAAIFIDFDGDSQSSTQPYDEDGDSTTFNTAEAGHIAECWRQMSVYYAMFDVDVTTIQPNVSTTPTAWGAIGNNISGGYSYVGVFPNSHAESWNNSGDARSRASGIAHEIGHNFGNGHQATWDRLANKTAEYASGIDTLHGPLMGVDYDGTVHKWILGHTSGSPSTLQDDMAVIANQIKSHAAAGYTGDGYAPDDYGGTIATAAPLPANGVLQSATGIIERLTDADAFSFTSSGGRYCVGAVRDAPSGVDLKLSIYNAIGALLASQDGDPIAQPLTMVNDQHLSLDLPTGTYYAIVESHGNYGDSGQYNLVVSPLPAGWSSQAVGLVGQNIAPGYVSYDSASSTFTVAGSGSDMTGTTDSFLAAYQVLQGDGTIVARVASMENTASMAEAGVMIRETLANNSKHAAMVMTSQNGPQMIWRSATAGSASEYHSTAAAFTPTWVKLVRSGDTFTGYRSSDGTNWTQWRQTTVSMSPTVYIGLMTCAGSQGAINAATFTSVSVTGTLNPGPVLNALPSPSGVAVTGVTSNSVSLSWSDIAGETGYAVERSSDGVNFIQAGTTAAGATTFTDSGLSGFQRYCYRVRAQDAAGLSVASSVVSGVTRADAVTSFSITSWNTTQLILNWREASGETGYRIERSPDGTSNWTTLGTVGKNVPSYTNSSLTSGTAYYYRVVTLDATGDAAVSPVAAGAPRLPAVTGLAFTNKAANQMAIQWTDIAAETNFRIERSTDGSTWSTLATVDAGVTAYADNSVSPLGEYYYRVVGVTSLTEGTMPTPIFAAAPASTPLPPAWQSQDIGSVAGAGAAGLSGGTFTVIASGSDIGGTADQFRFVHQPLSGDGWMIARVASQENTADGAKAGVMIRETLNANSRCALVLITPGNGTAFQYRSSAGGSTTSVAGPTGAAPYWVKISRAGNSFSAEVSTDGATWTTVGSQTITMAASVYIGLAVDSNASTALNKSTFTNVSLFSAGNTAPTVVIPAAAAPNPITGTSTTLSVLGADDGGEARLAYTWVASTLPSGAAAPTFSDNGANSSKQTTATFSQAGEYIFTATVADGYGLSVTGSVSVTVGQTLSGIAISPVSVVLSTDAALQFTAAGTDQFGKPMAVLSDVTWSASAGTIAADGTYSSPLAATTATVTAQSGSFSNTASVQAVAPSGRWKFDENNGTTVADSSGNGLDGTINGATWTAGPIGTPALHFDGVNDWVKITNAPAVNFAGQITIATWIKPSSITTIQNVVNHGASAGNSDVYLRVYYTGGVSTYQVGSNNGTTYNVQATIPPEDLNHWVHLAGVYDGTAWRIYRNGQLAASSSKATGAITSTNNWGIGSSGDGSRRWFQGDIDDVRIYNTALSPGAIAGLASSSPTVANPATATPSPVAGTTAALAVLGADDGGETDLSYTWAATTLPPGAASPVFSLNGTNAAKNASVTFSKAGTYGLTVTIADAFGAKTTSSTNVIVDQTLTAVAVSPATADLSYRQVLQFVATAQDQFGYALAVQPAFTWSATEGTIDAAGIYTAPNASASATITAQCGTLSGTAAVNVTNAAPTNIALSSSSVTENVSGATVGTLSTADPDASDTHTYALRDDPTGKFEIVGATLKLSDGQALDYEATPSVDLLVRTTDNGGLSFDKLLSIRVIDVNEPPVAVSKAVTVFRNSPAVALGIAAPADPEGAAVFVMVTRLPTAAQGAISLVDGTPVAVGQTLTSIQVTGLKFTPASGYTGTPAPLEYLVADRNLATSGLQGYWMLDESSGTSTADASGHGVTGTLTNGPVWNAGEMGGALTFDGTNDYVALGNPSALNITGQITIAAWVKPGSINTNQNVVNRGATSGNADVYLRIYNNTTYQAGSNDGAVHNTQAAIPAQDLNQWVHLAAVYDGMAWRLYRNGVLASSTSSSTGAIATTNSWAIGSSGNGSRRYLKGSVDEVRIYNRGLSAAEVTDLYGANVVSARVDLRVVANTAPTIGVPASATPSPVTESTTDLSVLGADDGGEANLTYTWATTTLPAGAADPAFSINGTGEAKNTTATFTKAGDYGFTVTITDAGGLMVTSHVAVTVEHALTSITVTPIVVNLAAGATQQFTALGKDQFGNALSPQPPFAWSATAGTINETGLYRAPNVDAAAMVTVQSGVLGGTASVNVVNGAPTVNTAALATPNPVAGVATALSILADDDAGEANLTYTWATTTLPAGAADPAFSINGTDKAKNTTATFTKAGDYGFTVTITDAGGLTVTSHVDVTVEQTLTSITVTPDVVNLAAGATQQFTALGRDQFGDALSPQPAFAWSATAGTINETGLYTAPYADTAATITAAGGAIIGTATVEPAPARSVTWNGSGDDDRWSIPANWAGGVAPQPGDRLVFTGATRTSTVNDYPDGTVFRSITLQTGGFTLSGNGVILTTDADVAIRNTDGANTIALPLRLAVDGTIAISGGLLAMTGTIDGGGSALSFDTETGATGSIEGQITRAGVVTQTGAGDLVLAGANSHSGGTSVQSGTLQVTNVNALPAGQSLTIASGGTVVLSSGLAGRDPTPALSASTAAAATAVRASSAIVAERSDTARKATRVLPASGSTAAQTPAIPTTTVQSQSSTRAAAHARAPEVIPAPASAQPHDAVIQSAVFDPLWARLSQFCSDTTARKRLGRGHEAISAAVDLVLAGGWQRK